MVCSLIVCSTFLAVSAFPQIPIPKLPRPPVKFSSEEALTTSLSEAVTEVVFLDDFDPKEAEPLSRQPRGPNGGFRVEKPGLYIIQVESYCLRPGTHMPGC